MQNRTSCLTDAVLRLADAVDSLAYRLSKEPDEQRPVEQWVRRPKMDRVRECLLAELAKTYCVRGVPKPWHYISHLVRGSASQSRRQAFAALAAEGLVQHDNVRCWLSPPGGSPSPPVGPGPNAPAAGSEDSLTTRRPAEAPPGA